MPSQTDSTEERAKKLLGSAHFFGQLTKVISNDAAALAADLNNYFQAASSQADFEQCCRRLLPQNNLLQLHQVSRIGEKISIERLFFRFAVIDPGFIATELQDVLARLPFAKQQDDSFNIFYQDEWLLAVANGEIHGLRQSHQETPRRSNNQYLQHYQKLETEMTQEAQQVKLLLARLQQLVSAELLTLKNSGMHLLDPEQKINFQQLDSTIKKILKIDHSHQKNYAELTETRNLLNSLGMSTLNNNHANVSKNARNELKALQLVVRRLEGDDKIPQPFLMPKRLHSAELGSRQRVLELLQHFENLDPGLFVRRYRNRFYRFAPQIILLPVHGSQGTCWQAFNRKSRTNSPAILILPMYCENLSDVVLRTLAELRWQTAKLIAGHYWLSEGLTGSYTSWLHRNRSKNNEEHHFILDYQNWLLFESAGNHRLANDVRTIFWQWLPFSDEHCSWLAEKDSVYGGLQQRYNSHKPGSHQLSPVEELHHHN